MIEIKRKIKNQTAVKTIANSINAEYTVNCNLVNSLVKEFEEKAANQTGNLAKLYTMEAEWLKKWLKELSQKYICSTDELKILSDLRINTIDNKQVIMSNDFTMDFYGVSIDKSTLFSPAEKNHIIDSAMRGVINSFRFYTREDCRTIVVDYHKILDYISLYYGYRALGYIEVQLENVFTRSSVSAAVLNEDIALSLFVGVCLEDYTGLNRATRLVEDENAGNLEHLTQLISECRIDNSCYQVIRPAQQVQTWLQNRIPLKNKMTYAPVLEESGQEIMYTIICSIAAQVENTPSLSGVKLLSYDIGDIALSVPNSVDLTELFTLLEVKLRLFNRPFRVIPRYIEYDSVEDKYKLLKSEVTQHGEL